MVNYAVAVYDDIRSAETAIELIANTVRIMVFNTRIDGKDRVVVITGGTY